MTIRFGALVVSALAIGCWVGPSFADTPLKPRRHHVVAPAANPTHWRELSEDFFSGPVNGSAPNDRYFNDTKQPPIGTLGAPFLSEWPD